MVGSVGQWVGLGQMTNNWINLDLIKIIQFCLNIYDLLDILDIFSCASAKAERSLSSLYGVFLCVELGDPSPSSQDFMGPDENTTPLLYDSKSAHDQKDPPPQLSCHGCIW